MNKKTADIMVMLSVVAAVISAYVSFTQSDILKLAGTQWILIAIVLGIYGLYIRERSA
ncbi:MAG TPA: hypothetical protein PLK35_02210 [Candidatus Moranbacteria bacterium]|nr:hypothetical protein [Candidatus Moranbacteria bacterium]